MVRLDRADLIALVAGRTGIAAVKRACLLGKVEVLGGFENLQAGDPGWLLKIVCPHGTEYIMAVVPQPTTHEYLVSQHVDIPWHHWTGNRVDRERYSVYAGDHPAIYDARRETAIEKRDRRRSVMI
jgi:hypothetical protein